MRPKDIKRGDLKMSNKLFKDLEFKVHSSNLEKSTTKDGKRLIKGYASTSDLDRQNEIISREALEGARNDLLDNKTVFMDHQHSIAVSLPIGKVVDCILDDKGLLITVQLSAAKFCDDIWKLCEEEILNSFSIGGVVLDGHDERSDDGKSYHVIDKILILEVSVVGIPAQQNAKFSPIYKSFNSAIAEQIKQKEGSVNMVEQDKKEVVKSEASEKVSEETKEEAKVEVKEEVVEEKKEVVEDDKPKIEVDVSSVEEGEKVEANVIESKDVVEPEKKEEEKEVVVEEVVEEEVEEKPAENEAKEDVVAESEAEVVEDKVEDEEEVVEKSEETSPEKIEKENEEAEEEEEAPAEKSTEEKILDALALIIEKLSAMDKKEIEEKKEVPEAEKSEDEEAEKQEEYECECLACGELVKTSEHCRDTKCQACGGEMRRKDRPGVGKDEEVEETKAVEKVEVEKKEEVKKEEEEPKRKSLAVVVPSHYEEESKPEEVKKTSNEGWKQVFFGK